MRRPSFISENSSPNASTPHDPYGALRLANFRYFLCGNTLSTVGMQMLALAVSWELFQSTHSVTALGLVGLLQALPILFLAIPAGHLADRFNRKTIILIDQLLLAFSAATLGFASLYQHSMPDWTILRSLNGGLAATAHFFHETGVDFSSGHVPIMLVLLFINAIIRCINQPAKQALLPQLVPAKFFPNAVTWSASMFETSTIVGPMLAAYVLAIFQAHGATRSWSYAAVYFITAVCQLGQWLFFLPITLLYTNTQREPLTSKSLHAGIRFVRQNKVILASITLDLFGVLFGGAVALLPVFAQNILGVGPVGLGWLRAAPSLGAITVALFIAHRPPVQKAGYVLLAAVAGFGLATIGFGLSTNFYLSLLCLFLVGFCDNISVIIRNTLVQLLTPDSLRGRVTAVKSVFSTSSNKLGDVESCLVALFLGPALSVVAGGVGTLLVVVAVARTWPQLRSFGALHECRPDENSPTEDRIVNAA